MGSWAEEPAVGQILGERWRLEAPLGGGAFGTVWSAIDGADGTRVAVKILHPNHADNPKVRGRFVQEAEIQSEIQHPVIVPVLAWRELPVPFLVMPLIEGDSLHERCSSRSEAENPLPLRAVAWLVEQMCDGVAVAHDRGVIHRDLKPKNILVNRRRQRPFVKILDFGVAKVLEGGQLPATTVGRVMGSVLYLAPEQVMGGGRPSPAVDQFALASIFFELLTLRRAWARDELDEPLPFAVAVGTAGDNNQMSVLKRIVRGPRPKLLSYRPEAGEAAEAALHRALHADPGRRFEDLRAFGGTLRRALDAASEP